MEKRRSICRGLLAIAMAVCAITIACDPKVRVEGTVVDHRGKALEGVTVRLQSEGRGPHKTETTQDGTFSIGMVGADPAHTSLLFEKKGYKTLQMPFDSTQASLRVTLETETLQGSH